MRAETIDAMLDESANGRKWYGPYRSMHEAYGVLAEEMMELLDAIHDNNEVAARHEAMQIAAVAYRFYRDGCERNPQQPEAGK